MINKIAIQSEGENIAIVGIVNFISGTNVTLDVEPDPNNQRVNVTVNSTGGGGGSTFVSGTAIVDFLSEENIAKTTILNAQITASNILGVSFFAQESTATSLDDFILNGVTFSIESIVDNVSFDVKATAANNASGEYAFKYVILYS